MFNHRLMKSRATRRFEKAQAKNNQNAMSAYMQELFAIDQLSMLLMWCGSKNLKVEFKRHGSSRYDYNESKIMINSHLSLTTQLYVLMHECGHFLIKKHSVVSNGMRYKYGYYADKKLHKLLAHRVDVVDEEIEAWVRGYKLAKRLHIKIDLKRFDFFKSKCIKSYFKWAITSK